MGENPFVTRRAKHAIGRSGRASEKKFAKGLDAKTRPASGAMPGAKGDMSGTRFLVEAKSTTRASTSIKYQWLSKIGLEAKSEGKTPALSVSFVNGDGSPCKDGEWVMIPAYLFREIFE